jgi:hypothetical protein
VWQTAASQMAPVRLEPAKDPPREDLQLETENNAPLGLHVFLASAEEPSSQEVALNPPGNVGATPGLHTAANHLSERVDSANTRCLRDLRASFLG